MILETFGGRPVFTLDLFSRRAQVILDDFNTFKKRST
jgi:hypothetical protein